MKIGIDARPLIKKWGGIPRVLREILEALNRIDQVNDYFLYANRDFELSFDNPRWHKRVDLLFSHLPGTLWLQIGARRVILRDRPDLFWGTSQVLPLNLPSTIAKLLTIHDLVWKRHPKTTTAYDQFIQRLFTKRSIAAADRILPPSGSTKKDILDLFGVPPEKIHVIYHGVSPKFRPYDSKYASESISSKYNLLPKYVFTVGTLEPRKNLGSLIDAFIMLKKRGNFTHQLVIAGPQGWGNLKLQEKAKKEQIAPDDIRFLGFVPDEDLPLLYSGAAAFVFPTLYEGFGLPLLEAMACGTPVACSNRSSLPEIGADAAIYFNPESADEIAHAIDKLLGDQTLRQNLMQRGLQRVQQFSWDSCARKFLAAFEEIRTAETLASR
ncbi:MAG TPA: glycosyltransferase family 1 protein [Terriglobia bacterium]|nr:glycosyltransferase family 1 protein [Terriglobia bacterium]